MRTPVRVDRTVTKMEAVLSEASWSVSHSMGESLADMSVMALVEEHRKGIDLGGGHVVVDRGRAAILQVRAALV